MDNPISYTIDLQPLIQPALEIMAGIVLALGIWALKRLSTKLGLEADDQIRQYLLDAVVRSVQYGKHKVAEEVENADWTKQEVKSKLLDQSAEFVITHVPDAVKKFKLSEEDVKDLVLAKLEDV